MDAVKEPPSQQVVLEYQKRDAIRIRQESYERQNQNAQDQREKDPLPKENEGVLKTKKQEELKHKEIQLKQDEERNQREQIAKQKAEYRRQGLCQYCGGTFKKKFLFFTSSICSRCGKKKDY